MRLPGPWREQAGLGAAEPLLTRAGNLAAGGNKETLSVSPLQDTVVGAQPLSGSRDLHTLLALVHRCVMVSPFTEPLCVFFF